MASVGRLWTPNKEAVVAALEKHHGIVTRAAKEFNVKRHTLKKKIDQDPELVELLQNLRDDLNNNFLDLAENCILAAMSKQQDDPSNAMRAAMFVLNSKGKEREWNNAFRPDTIQISQYDVENLKMENEALKKQLNDIHNKPQAESELSASDTSI